MERFAIRNSEVVIFAPAIQDVTLPKEVWLRASAVHRDPVLKCLVCVRQTGGREKRRRELVLPIFKVGTGRDSPSAIKYFSRPSAVCVVPRMVIDSA